MTSSTGIMDGNEPGHTHLRIKTSTGRRLYNGETSFIDLNPQDFERQRIERETNGAKKRTRTMMTPFQNKVLRRILARTCFPSATLRNSLSQMLGISSRTIQIWFQNQRQKAKQKLTVDLASNIRIQQTFGEPSTSVNSLDILASAATSPIECNSLKLHDMDDSSSSMSSAPSETIINPKEDAPPQHRRHMRPWL
jgi:hypothetical protein